jgi:purine-binding chemotaxis protein CheW
MAETAAITGHAIRHFCTFRLAGRLFGFDLFTVKEVNTQTRITPVPHAPAVVRGYVNLRGNVALVLDMRLVLGLQAGDLSADCRVVMLKASVGESFGVLVDQIGDIVRLRVEDIESGQHDAIASADGSAVAPQAHELVEGIGKLDTELLIIVDPKKLLRVTTESLRA